MTVTSETYKADSTGNGVTTEFSVPFSPLDASHILVTKVSTSGVETVLTLNTEYTVTGVGTEDAAVVLTTALPVGERVIRSPNIPLTQLTDYVNGEKFPADSHERGLDLLTLICQQLQEQLDRTVKLSISSTDDIDTLITNINSVAGVLTELVTVAGIASDVTTTAAIDSAVSTLSAISSDISSVSAISTNVTDVAAIDSDVSAVAALSAAVGTLSGIASDISEAASKSADITTVAGISSDVTTVAGIEADILAVPALAQSAADSAAVAATFNPALFLARSGGTMTGDIDLDGNQIIGLTTLPVGAEMDWHNATPPDGWFIQDGSTFDETVYPLLYAHLGNSNILPDMRGVSSSGVDAGRGLDPSMDAAGKFLAGEIKSHTHTGSTNTTGDHTHSLGNTGDSGSIGSGGASGSFGGSTGSAGSHSHTLTIDVTGGTRNTIDRIGKYKLIKHD